MYMLHNFSSQAAVTHACMITDNVLATYLHVETAQLDAYRATQELEPCALAFETLNTTSQPVANWAFFWSQGVTPTMVVNRIEYT